MAYRQPGPTDSLAPRAALGWVLHARADDVAAEVVRRVQGYAWPGGADPSPAVLKTIADADRLATEVMGRWLATGVGATDEEHARLSGLGSLVGAVPLPALVKAYLAWRDAAVDVLGQEARRLDVGEALLNEATLALDRSCDASLVRMARQFDLERNRLQDELAHQALHDYLTGLPNRLLLYDRIEHALRSAGRYGGEVALLFVDLDGFKAVNDSFGHEAGDRLLVEVAARLRTAVRPSDTAARLGGDEFIVLCDRFEDAGEAEGAAVADRMLAALRLPFSLDAGEAAVSASIGIAIASETEEPDELVHRADAAMYAAKRRGDTHEFAPHPETRSPVA